MEYLQKHRTVGVSMHPDLEKRAKAQASSLGLKFSPYVTLCIEAEMRGDADILNKPNNSEELPFASAINYMERKTAFVDFCSFIEETLIGLCTKYTRNIHIDSLYSDFGINTPKGIIALECCPNIHNHYPRSLGQSILLKSSKRVSEVILLAPYLQGFNPLVKKQLDLFDIRLSSPDLLKDTLTPLLARFS